MAGKTLKPLEKIVWRITIIAGTKRTMDPALHKKQLRTSETLFTILETNYY